MDQLHSISLIGLTDDSVLIRFSLIAPLLI